MSGFFGKLLSDFLGKQDPATMFSAVQQIVEQNGGVEGLVQRFRDSGYAEHIQSWIDGDHTPITGKQLTDVFSSEQVNGWASQFGVDPDRFGVVLAEALPHVVEFLSRRGEVTGESFDLSALLKRFTGG